MKKLLLGMGILALSAAALGSVSGTATVNVSATVIETGSAVVLYNSATGTAVNDRINSVAISHGETNFGTKVAPSTTTDFYVAFESASGTAIPLGAEEKYNSVVGTIAETTDLKYGGTATSNAYEKFETVLTVKNDGGFTNGRKLMTVTSTPTEASAAVVPGAYSSAETLTIVVDKK